MLSLEFSRLLLADSFNFSLFSLETTESSVVEAVPTHSSTSSTCITSSFMCGVDWIILVFHWRITVLLIVYSTFLCLHSLAVLISHLFVLECCHFHYCPLFLHIVIHLIHIVLARYFISEFYFLS